MAVLVDNFQRTITAVENKPHKKNSGIHFKSVFEDVRSEENFVEMRSMSRKCNNRSHSTSISSTLIPYLFFPKSLIILGSVRLFVSINKEFHFIIYFKILSKKPKINRDGIKWIKLSFYVQWFVTENHSFSLFLILLLGKVRRRWKCILFFGQFFFRI